MLNCTAARGALAATVTSILLLGMVAASEAHASTLWACVKKNGSAHVFRRKPRCKRGESRLSWNSRGPAGKNGTSGARGVPGAAGAPGQPQKALAFSVGSEAAIVPPALTTVFSSAGVTVRLSCSSALTSSSAALEAAGSGRVESGQVNSTSEGKATEELQRSVWDASLSSTGVPFARLKTNFTAPAGNVAHVNASIATSSAVVVIDAFLSVGFSSPGCQARGIAYSIPL